MTTASAHRVAEEISTIDTSLPTSIESVEDVVSTSDGSSIDDVADADTVGAPQAVAMLAGHKGKLAIGVAATLGLMVYYGWREKRLAQTDPEEYARLQRIKAGLRSNPDWPQPEDDCVNDAVTGSPPGVDSKI